ncbi:glycosyltransferase family 1 protein [Myxosarcina sp. GI1]|uniref:glycosyltransferase family 4 protein n=1 Tax=Myxosarcina sp. GI1 TaxID=1541065 RepID=UPI00056014F3|nr:glycosyltransferase family 1 protein [Myxosarcina sp. GI1]
MNDRATRAIALISVHGDPAVEIGREEAGGQNVYVRQVGEALARQGWHVDMFTRASSSQQPKIVEHGDRCRTVRLTAGPEKFIPRQDIFDYGAQFVNSFLEFQTREKLNYFLIHTNYWISGWVGLQLRQQLAIPQIHTYHSLGAVKYQTETEIPKIGATRLKIERDCLERADCIIATSPQEKEHMRSLVSQLGNIEVIPCGTDIRRFYTIGQTEGRSHLGIPKNAKVIFYIGRFDRRKGIETLVRAIGKSSWKDDDRLQLIIGGGSRPGESDGLERERIEAIVVELKLEAKTFFPGRISDLELPLYYAAADVCVVPSHYEPFGLVAIESMASGTPVVASNVGGLQYTIVDGETGLLAPAKDVRAFAIAIDRLLNNSKLRDTLGKNARKRVEEKFSWEGVATQLEQLYLKLINQTAFN